MIKRIYEYLRLLQFKRNPASTLKGIHIQFTNTCNLNCKWCSFINPNVRKNMDLKLITKFIKEIMESKRFHIKELNLWSAGEPLMHPDFVKIMELLAFYKIKYPNFPKVKILTNTMLLTEELSKKIIEIDAIDYIGFSIDGGSKEEFERLRSGGKFDIVKKNIKTFTELNKGKIETMVNSVIPIEKPLNTDWMTDDFKEILNSVDFYKLNYPDNNAGEILIEYPTEFKFNKTNKKICLAMIQSLVVIQNGDVLICCDDFNGKHPLGNLYEKSLFEICNSDARKSLVKNYFKGNKIKLCQNCNRFETPYEVFKNE